MKKIKYLTACFIVLISSITALSFMANAAENKIYSNGGFINQYTSNSEAIVVDNNEITGDIIGSGSTATTDIIKSVAVFNGALTAEADITSTGPTCVIGFIPTSNNDLTTASYFQIDKNGYAIFKAGDWQTGDYASRFWPTILGADAASFIPVGDGSYILAAAKTNVKVTVDSEGIAKFYLTFTGVNGLNSNTEFNAKITDGSFGIVFGLNDSKEYVASSTYIFVKKETAGYSLNIKKGQTESKLADLTVDLTNPTLFKMSYIAGNKNLKIFVGNIEVASETIDSLDGFSGFMSDTLTQASLGYVKIYDTNASNPVITLSSITEGSTGTEYNLFSTVTDEVFNASEIINTYEVSYNGFEYDVSDISKFVPYDTGIYTIKHTAKNPAGLSDTKSFTFTATAKKGSVIGNSVTSANDKLVTVKSFSGSMKVDVEINSVGPCIYVGFIPNDNTNPSYIQMDLNGYGIFKNGTWFDGDYADSKWTGILNETADKFFEGTTLAGGRIKVTVEISANGTAKFYLTFIEQTVGSGLKTTPYLIAETGDLFTNIVTGGGKLFVTGLTSAWGHITTINSVKVSDNNDGIIFEDDFSINNFNGEGLQKWTTQSSNYTFPILAKQLFSGEKTAAKNTMTVTNSQIITGSFNAETQGVFGAAFALSETGLYNENSYLLYVKKSVSGSLIGIKKGAEIIEEEVLTDIDITKPALFSYRYIVASGSLEISVNSAKIKTFILTDSNFNGAYGYRNESGNSSLGYYSVKINQAASPVITVPNISAAFMGEVINLNPSVTDDSFSLEEIQITTEISFNGTVLTVADIKTFTPSAIGTYTVKYTAINSAEQSAEKSFSFTVSYDKPEINAENTDTYYYGLDQITFNPNISDRYFEKETLVVSIKVYEGGDDSGTEVTKGIDGLKFTPEKTGTYTVFFTVKNSQDLTSSVSKKIIVVNNGKQADIYTKFENSDLTAFNSKEVSVLNGKATLGANSFFGTKGGARNFAQMIRLTSFDATANDLTMYFGKINETDTPYTVTFTKGSTLITITDSKGTTTLDIKFDIFNIDITKYIVIQLLNNGGKIELSMMHSNQPYEILNIPVAAFDMEFEKIGTVGISTLAGGVTFDRFIFVNYSDYSEIPDDIVPPDPDPITEPEKPVMPEPESGCNKSCKSAGFISDSNGNTAGLITVLLILSAFLMCLKKSRKEN